MSEILIQNVSKTYSTKDGNVQALKNVNLSIEQGDIYGIIGMSGAGKSTLVRCINYLEEPTEGKIFIKGKELGSFSKKELRKQREDIGMIFQHFNLLMQKSVLENICFPLYIHGKKKTDARKRAKELLEIVGLSDKAKAYPAQLSGGQKQRIAIARVFLKDPKILILDEATSALDNESERFIQASLEQLAKNRTTIVIAHRLSTIRHADEILVIDQHQIIERGSHEELLKQNGLYTKYYNMQFDGLDIKNDDVKHDTIIEGAIT